MGRALLHIILFLSPPPTPNPSWPAPPTQGIAVLESHRWPMGSWPELERVDSGYRSTMSVQSSLSCTLSMHMAARSKSKYLPG